MLVSAQVVVMPDRKAIGGFRLFTLWNLDHSCTCITFLLHSELLSVL